jgi:hypothetical protein
MAIKMTKGVSLFVAAVLLVSACAPIRPRESTPQEPRKLSVTAKTKGWSVSPPLSVPDIERKDPTLVPPVAARDSGNKEWQSFKALMQPGDSLHFLRYIGWTGAVGASELMVSDSYIIVRNDLIVAELVVGQS